MQMASNDFKDISWYSAFSVIVEKK